jgi:large subunit ribosomal protein L17
MRHGKSGRKLNRTSSHRLAMFRNMVTSLLEHERIYTTEAKAKELRRWADWMITLGKRGDLHARRQALRVVRDKKVVDKVFEDLAQRYQARSGGYTRSVKVGFRAGDAAPMSLIELMTGETAKKKKKRKAAKAKPAKKAAKAVETVEVATEAAEKKVKKPKAVKAKPAKEAVAKAEAPEPAEVAAETAEKKAEKPKAEKVAPVKEDAEATEAVEEATEAAKETAEKPADKKE